MWFLFLLLAGISGIGAIVFLVFTIMKKRRAWIGLVVSIVIGGIATFAFLISAVMSIPGIDEPAAATMSEEVEEPPEDKTDSIDEEERDAEEGLYNINEDYEVNGLDISIKTIEITEKDVKIGLEIENNSDSTKTFYPDQGDIIIGKKQIGANMFMTKGDVSGDIHAGVAKEGTVKFLADDELSPEDISEIKLAFGNIYDDETFESEDFTETVSLK